MTVSEFAIAMYGCDIAKDKVKVIRDGEVLYHDRMEFLRYADEPERGNLWYAGEEIQTVKMEASQNVREIDYGCDYVTELYI